MNLVSFLLILTGVLLNAAAQLLLKAGTNAVGEFTFSMENLIPYENPKFVEDIIRDLALAMEKEPSITWYSIESENFESIHNHNAYAQIERQKSEAAPALRKK